jgi:hypothetical protein
MVVMVVMVEEMCGAWKKWERNMFPFFCFIVTICYRVPLSSLSSPQMAYTHGKKLLREQLTGVFDCNARVVGDVKDMIATSTGAGGAAGSDDDDDDSWMD